MAISRLVNLGVLRRGGAIVADTFTRADSAVTLGSAETGQAWSALSGTWGISGSKAYLASTTAQAVAIVESGAADADVSVDVTLSASASRADVGIAFRVIDDNNYLLAAFTKTASDAITIFKRSAGAFTQLAILSGAGNINGSTYTFRVRVRGTSVEVFRDGESKLAHTLSGADQTAYGAATKHGLRLNWGASNDDGGSRFDNFRISR